MNSIPRPKCVLWITADHLRYDCIGANGNSAIRTPHLDALARGGASFDNLFVQSPVCMPSRCSFMTGLYPAQTGVTTNGMALPDSVRTCAQYFVNGGYRTAQVGKLHFQPHEESDLDPRARNTYGFDICALSEEPNCYDDAYRKWLLTEHPRHEAAMRIPRVGAQRGNFDMWTVDAPAEASHSGFCASQAMRWIDHGGPLFMHMGLFAPHPPLNPPAEVLAQYADVQIPKPIFKLDEAADKPEPLKSAMSKAARREAGDYQQFRKYFYAMCTLLDSQIGRVIEHLKKRNLFDDTLIVFMSDHGEMAGDHGLMAKGVCQMFHQVMRVPCIIHWPRAIGAGKRISGLSEAIDLLPTLLELCGIQIRAKLSGRSLADNLIRPDLEHCREDVFAQFGAPGQPLIGDLRTERFHYIRYGKGREVLFDLREDPDEFVNCASNSSYAGDLIEMRERLLDRTLAASATQLEQFSWC